MGLLDRWTKKTTAKQLARTDERSARAEAEQVAVAPKAKEVVTTGGNFRVIVRPLVTEKSAHSEKDGKYSFIVVRWASKTAVKQAVKELYGVEPLAVNMVNVQGKRVRFGRSFGRRADFKKAVVTLPKGKTITIHEGV